MFNPRTADSVIQATRSLGVEVPIMITKTQEKVRRYQEIAAGFVTSPNALVDAAQAAIDDDRDPATDPEVQRIIAGQALGNPDFTHRLTVRAVETYERVIREYSSRLIERWAKVFDAAAADVEAGVAVLGDIKLSDSETILAKGGVAAEAWGKAVRGNQVISDILTVWIQLNMISPFALYDRNRQVFRFLNPTVEEYYSLNLHDRKLSAWEAAQMGLTLSLADGPEYMARVANLEQQEAAEIERQRNESTGKLSDRDRRMMKQATDASRNVAVDALMAPNRAQAKTA